MSRHDTSNPVHLPNLQKRENCRRHDAKSLLDLRPNNTTRISLLHEESPLHELENLVDEDDRGAPPEHNFPLAPAERHDAEDVLQDRSVEEAEVEGHGEGDGVDEDHVLPQGEGEEGLGGREGVHGVEHLDDDEDGERDGRGCFGGGVGEDVAADRGEDGAAAVEVGLR